MVVCVTGNTVYGHGTTKRSNPNRVAVLHSRDGGHTWSQPVDITEQVYSLFDKSNLGPVDAMFFGSGRICQSQLVKVGRYYRLYAALCARPGGNRVVYSDDLGRTWHALGDIHTSPAPTGDEPKVEELPDGSVVLSSRISGGRLFNISTISAIRTPPARGKRRPLSRKTKKVASKPCKTARTAKFSSSMRSTTPTAAKFASLCRAFPSVPDAPMWVSTTKPCRPTNATRPFGKLHRQRFCERVERTAESLANRQRLQHDGATNRRTHRFLL